jgi:eukaryotic-like serine/threonine-protein kinase
MNPSPNREVVLFSAALELVASERMAYLDKVCADDPALRLRLEDLLRVHDEAALFLENAPAGTPRGPMPGPGSDAGERSGGSPVEKEGDRIGRYKLLQQIGEGGCGVVYMAEQEEPVRRRVALKVIKLGMDTRRVVARFEAERQALALMDHPNIAKVLDAGASDAGRPYFVMELVRGIRITSYCDQENLSTAQRLELFIQVCQAIQHAHQKGIIHRDIKPSNILVADHDGVPVPKVIDFGVAKATTGQHLTDKTLFTAFEQFIGTPAYMSPEQAKLSGLDIDTRTDIYSLGVLLYELLTGKTPLDQEELLAAGLDEMRRTIREKEPVRPSTRLSTMLVDDLTLTAKHRRIEPPKLVHLLRGDLDWIVMKALEKDRARRYETANGLARDVQRHLADELVVARPPSKLYRLQKMARRNKLAFAAGAAVLLTLLAGLVASNWFYFREKAANRRAVASAKQARAINRFLTEDLLFQATPEQNSRQKKVTMEEVLSAATSSLDRNAGMAQQPEVEATLRLDFGITFIKLSRLAEAETNLMRAFELRRRALGPQHLDTLAAEHELAGFLITREGKFEQAEPLIREAWEGRQRLLGATHRDTIDSLQGCDIILQLKGRLVEAEQLGRQILHTCEQALGPDDSLTLDALRNLGGILSQLGDHEQSEQLERKGLARSRLTKNREQELWAVNQIAMQRMLQDDAEGANKLLAEAVPSAALEFGAESSLVLWTQRIWARALADLDQLERAETLAKSTLEYKRLTPDSLGIARTALILGRVLAQQNKLAEAEPLLQEALTFFREHPIGKRDALAVQAANWLGAIRVAGKAYREAETLLLSGSDELFSPAAEMSPTERRLAVSHLVSLYKAWGNPHETAFWQTKLDALASSFAQNQGRDIPNGSLMRDRGVQEGR